MQFSATRRFRNGVSFGGNYTLSLSDNGTTGVPLRLQHNADGSFFVREDQAIFNELMQNQGLQRHIFKANFIWDLPDWQTTGAGRIAAAIVNDWQLSGIFTGGSGARYDITYQYQNNGANVNLTGSPDYAARVVINGRHGERLQRRSFPAVHHGGLFGTASRQPGPRVRPQLHDRLCGQDDRSGHRPNVQARRSADGPVPARDVQRLQRASSTTPGKRSCSLSARPTRPSGTRSSSPMAAWIPPGSRPRVRGLAR